MLVTRIADAVTTWGDLGGEEAGLVVPPEQPRALADAILRVSSDPDLAREMGRRGRRLVEERYGLDRSAQRHLWPYELALAHHRVRGRRTG